MPMKEDSNLSRYAPRFGEGDPAMHHLDRSLGPCRVIVTDNGEVHAADTPENRDLARRLKACVNACAGFTTEELESGIIEDMRRVIANVAPLLRDRRDDLKRVVASDDRHDAVA